jgi:hypothetical protein
MPKKSQAKQPPGRENGLTPITQPIHCPATTERVGGPDEIDDISCKAAQNQGGGEVGP